MFINFQLSRHECISLSVSLSILVAIEYSVYLSSISTQEVCRNVAIALIHDNILDYVDLIKLFPTQINRED